jgi:hypothetical protein
VKGASRKKQQRAKSPSREVDTVVVDVIEEPVPGVVTVTEFEETQIPGRGWVETKGDHKKKLISQRDRHFAFARHPFNDDAPVFSVCKELLATDGRDFRVLAAAFA